MVFSFPETKIAPQGVLTIYKQQKYMLHGAPSKFLINEMTTGVMVVSGGFDCVVACYKT